MKLIRSTPAAQKGASLYAMIVVMTLLGVIILAGLKISPAYIDDQVVRNALSNLQESGELSSLPLRDIRAYVSRTVIANRTTFDSDGIDQVEENNVEYIVVQYEARVPMLANIDAVVKFDYRFEK